MRFEATQGIEAVKATKLKEAKSRYQSICSGTDPTTNKSIYVDCIVGETTYRMNAGRKASETLFFALQKAQLKGAEQYFLVDVYDDLHAGVPIADCLAVNVAQGDDAETHYLQYQMMKKAIGEANNAAEVRAVPLTFDVKVLPG